MQTTSDTLVVGSILKIENEELNKDKWILLAYSVMTQYNIKGKVYDEYFFHILKYDENFEKKEDKIYEMTVTGLPNSDGIKWVASPNKQSLAMVERMEEIQEKTKEDLRNRTDEEKMHSAIQEEAEELMEEMIEFLQETIEDYIVPSEDLYSHSWDALRNIADRVEKEHKKKPTAHLH